MTDLAKLPTWADEAEDLFRVVVETPRGSRMKFAWDAEMKAFGVSRPLAMGVQYPYDWGFIPGTLAPDGDPLDAMILASAPSHPGIVVACRAGGVVRLSQKGDDGRERNDRIIAIPVFGSAVECEGMDDLLDKRRRKELEQFFVSATLFEHKAVRIEGWDGAKAALKLIRKLQQPAA